MSFELKREIFFGMKKRERERERFSRHEAERFSSVIHEEEREENLV